MLKVKNILFLVYTEYHLLMIVSLMKNYFSEGGQFHCTLLIRSKEGSNRFQHRFDWSFLPVEYHFLPVSERTYRYSKELGQLLGEVLERDYSHYITFLEHTALNYYITGQLTKRGVKICLAPEGTRPYITISKSALFSRLRFTFENYRFLSSQRLAWNRFQINSNKHGFLKENSEVWVEHPDLYPNLCNRKVRQIELFKSLAEVEIAQKFFGFIPEQELPELSNVIFYVNHWFVVQELYQYELGIIEAIQTRFPDRPVLMKLHPNTPNSQKEKFESLTNVRVLNSTLPAELFILSLRDSIVLSFWSASLLINNSSCRFYWMHKVLKKANTSMEWWNIINPSRHIIEPMDISEIR